MFVCLKDDSRTCASFTRTIRAALRRLCIDVPLRVRWCSLTTAREAPSICMTDNGQSGAARDMPVATRIDGVVDEDIRVVTIH